MNLADIIILITLIPTVIVGIKKGFISQAISMLTIVIGFWASSLFANEIASWLSEHVSADEQILKIAGQIHPAASCGEGPFHEHFISVSDAEDDSEEDVFR